MTNDERQTSLPQKGDGGSHFISGEHGHGFAAQSANTGHYAQLNTYDYLADVPGNSEVTDLVEVQFKNTRKAYFHNSEGLPLKKGDIVAVESNPGHDIGVVSLTGKLVPLQMKHANLKANEEIRKIYRLARENDMERYAEAKAREHDTMIQSRQIAKDLGLEMKIRIGGFGPCGRELCCAGWLKNFQSVGTGAARFQDLSLNPQKLAGQCAKLKCCMNYEVDQYVESYRKLPPRDIILYTQDSEYYLFKTDILAQLVTYSTDKRNAANLVTISAERAKAVIEMNQRGEKPVSLEEGGRKEPERPVDLATQEDLNRFDSKKKHKKKHKKKVKNEE